MVKKMKLDKEDIQQISGGRVERGWLYEGELGQGKFVYGYAIIDNNTDEVVGMFPTWEEAIAADKKYHQQKDAISSE